MASSEMGQSFWQQGWGGLAFKRRKTQKKKKKKKKGGSGKL